MFSCHPRTGKQTVSVEDTGRHPVRTIANSILEPTKPSRIDQQMSEQSHFNLLNLPHRSVSFPTTLVIWNIRVVTKFLPTHLRFTDLHS